MATEECHLEVEVAMYRIMDRIIEQDCSILTVIEMTLVEEILEKCKIIEVRIIEVDIETTAEITIEITVETITETTILEEIEVCPGKDNTHVTLEGMIEAVADPDQVQEPVQIETELDVLNVENTAIF